MATILLAKSAPVAVVSAVLPPKKRGRPARPWLNPYVSVPHPLDARQDRTVAPATVAAWCGVSRQTAARWAAAPATMPAAALRLSQHYAHGLPPIPPASWRDPGAAGWLAFSFYQDRSVAGAPWLLAAPGQRPANWCQVHALFVTLPAVGALVDRCQRSEARAMVAEREAARLQELLACQV